MLRDLLLLLHDGSDGRSRVLVELEPLWYEVVKVTVEPGFRKHPSSWELVSQVVEQPPQAERFTSVPLSYKSGVRRASKQQHTPRQRGALWQNPSTLLLLVCLARQPTPLTYPT